jgi:hypothetical protein
MRHDRYPALHPPAPTPTTKASTRWRSRRMRGETRARRSVDSDGLRVHADRTYDAMRLRVFHGLVELRRVQMRFRNGSTREIEVRQLPGMGAWLRAPRRMNLRFRQPRQEQPT